MVQCNLSKKKKSEFWNRPEIFYIMLNAYMCDNFNRRLYLIYYVIDTFIIINNTFDIDII